MSARLAASALVVLLALLLPAGTSAQDASPPPPPAPSKVVDAAKFVGGGAIGLAAHEAGHLLFNVVFDAQPHLDKVDFHGIPFFAISHRSDLPPRQEYVISAAGFWVQNATNEWLLSRRPHFRQEHAPVAKGVFTFNVLASVAYAGAAFAKTGPLERDTRGMAVSARIDERWVGAMVLAPAILDSWRYFQPEAKWAAWASRGAKVLLVVMAVR